MKQVQKHYALNATQIQLLKTIYKFRFVTLSLLAQYRQSDRASLNRNLQRLVDQGYLDRLYDNSYRIDRKGARFSLAPKAITLLMRNTDLSQRALHSMYKNKHLEEPFIVQCLAIMQVAIHFKEIYPDTFYIYSTSEISRDIDFPTPRPSLYVRRIQEDPTKTREYYVELHHTTQPFLLRKRFNQLVDHYDTEGWPDGPYPTLLFILATPKQELAFARYARKVLDYMGIDVEDLPVLLTTFEKFITPLRQPITWTQVS